MTSDEMRDVCRRLLVLAKKFERQAGEQYDCCHGNDAEDTLRDGAEDIRKVIRTIELADADLLRAAMRTA